MQIELGKTLDVEVVERQLAELWKQTSDDTSSDDDVAILRARVANLLVFVAEDPSLKDAEDMMLELTAIHPSRVLLMLGESEAEDHDIEMSIASFCETDKRTRSKRLCCEQVTLAAQGKFRAELPSAALPIIVSDLPTFLWWRDRIDLSDRVFSTLVQAADRLVVDSADFGDPTAELMETKNLFGKKTAGTGISDLNWARLTSWRGLLADFYDVPAYQPWLDEIDQVQIDYVAPGRNPSARAPQALLLAGWLASRLNWNLEDKPATQQEAQVSFRFIDQRQRPINLALNSVEQDERKQGRLVRVELRSTREQPAFFRVSRSDDNLHLLTEAAVGSEVQRGRVLPVRNRSAAQLLSREMEILSNDNIYQAAISVVTKLIDV